MCRCKLRQLKHWVRFMPGDSLLEVMLALWLIGLAALGTMRIQLWAVRSQQSILWRTYALNLADAAAEALRAGYPATRVATEWQTRAADLLPSGGIRIIDQAPETRLIVLHWQRPAQWLSYFDPERSAADECPSNATEAIEQCVVLAVAK